MTSLNGAMLEALRAEYAKIDRIDPSLPAYGKLTALLDRADRNMLVQLSAAGIKFVSSLAANRLRSRGPATGKRYSLIRRG